MRFTHAVITRGTIAVPIKEVLSGLEITKIIFSFFDLYSGLLSDQTSIDSCPNIYSIANRHVRQITSQIFGENQINLLHLDVSSQGT